ncbi:hypothetical protein HHX47_DHR10000237, partial [Lentinula edodes]
VQSKHTPIVNEFPASSPRTLVISIFRLSLLISGERSESAWPNMSEILQMQVPSTQIAEKVHYTSSLDRMECTVLGVVDSSRLRHRPQTSQSF